ncbi:AraC family transcriptional regulator [Pseudomaricurvus alkylphenolicus]|uniref:AraC family transcriptional regulator n=1 Tax=Pseudomaricurvus alkylphenolicus TaxID=1306991 RepID=UPI001420A8D0|nr:AraC family transcriptional regulator [Pseudomaricurvus alkylphenolicus]NIB38454.1 AraC family transcriptional regulator [Pseudomaricurvus alkylphenolicus]
MKSCEYSDNSCIVLSIVKALDEVGLDSREILQHLDIDPNLLGAGDCRVSQEQMTTLWKLAEKRSGDESLGLRAARHVRLANLQIVGYAMHCSGTLERALQRLIRFRRLVSDAGIMDLSQSGNLYRFCLILDTQGGEIAYQSYDFCIASLVVLLREIAGDTAFTPYKICLERAQPENIEQYQDLFQCKIEYEQPQTCIYLNRSQLQQPIPTGNEHLAAQLDDIAEKQINQLDRVSFKHQVRTVLNTHLHEGEPSKSLVAQAFRISNRTLLRRLREECTTYQEVLNELREEMACSYLRRPGMTLDKTSTLLGFSDVSTFSRAFKNWTGKSPSLWREQSSMTKNFQPKLA